MISPIDPSLLLYQEEYNSIIDKYKLHWLDENNYQDDITNEEDWPVYLDYRIKYLGALLIEFFYRNINLQLASPSDRKNYIIEKLDLSEAVSSLKNIDIDVGNLLFNIIGFLTHDTVFYIKDDSNQLSEEANRKITELKKKYINDNGKYINDFLTFISICTTEIPIKLKDKNQKQILYNSTRLSTYVDQSAYPLQSKFIKSDNGIKTEEEEISKIIVENLDRDKTEIKLFAKNDFYSEDNSKIKIKLLKIFIRAAINNQSDKNLKSISQLDWSHGCQISQILLYAHYTSSIVTHIKEKFERPILLFDFPKSGAGYTDDLMKNNNDLFEKDFIYKTKEKKKELNRLLKFFVKHSTLLSLDLILWQLSVGKAMTQEDLASILYKIYPPDAYDKWKKYGRPHIENLLENFNTLFYL